MGKIYIGVKERPNNNLVQNGSFDANVSGWTAIHSSYTTLTFESVAGHNSAGSANFKITTPYSSNSNTYFYQSINLVQNHKYYAEGWIRGSLANTSETLPRVGILNSDNTWLNAGTTASSKSIGWQQVSAYGTASATGTGKLVCMMLMGDSSTVAANSYVFFDDIIAYDLTEMFGSGKEPTKAWCQSNLYEEHARKVSKMYIGVSDKARKIKRGYVGVNGKARLFYSSTGTIKKYSSSITTLSQITATNAGASVGDYAVFAGGYRTDSRSTEVVNAYNKSLVRTIPTALTSASGGLAGASIGDYALFAGGHYNSSKSYFSTVYTYDKSLAKGTATSLSVARMDLVNANVGNYTIFAGGYNGSYRNEVDAYNKSLARISPTSLTTTRYRIGAASNGAYAIFAGGQSSSTSSRTEVVAYNASLVKSTPTALSYGRYHLAGARVGNYALFAGGRDGDSGDEVAYLEVYNSSLVKTTGTSLSEVKSQFCGATLGEYAIFAGGTANGTTLSSMPGLRSSDYYNEKLVHTTGVNLGTGRYALACAVVDNKLLFAGGMANTTRYNNVDCYYLD